jgi:hypothetical protein
MLSQPTANGTAWFRRRCELLLLLRDAEHSRHNVWMSRHFCLAVTDCAGLALAVKWPRVHQLPDLVTHGSQARKPPSPPNVRCAAQL